MSDTFCCSAEISASDVYVVGRDQLPPHTAAQHRNNGSNIHQRRRTKMAKYSSHPRGTRSSSLSGIACLSVDMFFSAFGSRLSSGLAPSFWCRHLGSFPVKTSRITRGSRVCVCVCFCCFSHG